MKRLLLGCLVCCVAVAPATLAQAAKPLDIIKQAIEANGGKQNLLKFTAMTAKGKGVVNTQGMEFKYDATWKFHYPGRIRVDIQAKSNGKNTSIVQIFNGNEGWQQIAGTRTRALNADQITAYKKQIQVEEAGRLLPLLDTRKYQISPVGDSDVKGKQAVGLKVTTKDGLDVTFYFDKKTHMLVKKEYQAKNESGQDVMLTVLFSRYQKAKGVAIPMKREILHDGKNYVTTEYDEVEVKDKIEASAFNKP